MTSEAAKKAWVTRKANGDFRVDTPCECTRFASGALFLCQVHAPIPYTLTDKGHREAERQRGLMKQWDAIKDSLVEAEAARALLLRGARAAGRRIERREARRNGRTR